MYQFLKRLKKNTEIHNYGRDIVARWARDYARGKTGLTVLDLGMGEGGDLENIRRIAPAAKLIGFESYGPYVEAARARGTEVHQLDIERAAYPLPAGSVDIVVANQVLEHTKEIFWIFSEMHRVLKPGGIVILGVPNLGSLHNRVALLLGMQPPTILTLGPHVRGFTKGSLRTFIEYGGLFRLLDYRGANFYPFPAQLGRRLAQVMPGLAVGNFYLIKKVKEGSFLTVLDDIFLETPYFRGLSREA